MKVFENINRIIGCLLLAVCLAACSGNAVKKFREAMAVGNLSEAQKYLTEIDDRVDCKSCALQLIQTYIEVDAPEKAIHVYEHITPWHKDRYNMKWHNGNYEREVCKLLRSYLVKNGEYELPYLPNLITFAVTLCVWQRTADKQWWGRNVGNGTTEVRQNA